MDERLVDYLSKHCATSRTNELSLSHQQIAQELNTSREVISRLLKKMENDGMVELGRNRIVVLNLPEL
jgi:CRP/FNR family transcriptional regulator